VEQVGATVLITGLGGASTHIAII